MSLQVISRRRALLLGIAAAGVWAAYVLELSPADLVPREHGIRAASEFFGEALRPAVVDEDSGELVLLPIALRAARDTVIFAAAGMSLALLLGLGLGFLASSATWQRSGGGRWVRLLGAVAPAIYLSTRLLIALMRSVHELVWAILFLCALGLSSATAVIAIAIPFGGTLAKIFSEMIDEAPRDAASALELAGSSPAAAFTWGLLPRALPDMTAYSLYRFECALRSSAILGFFGFPTLGLYIHQSFENLYYREVWTYLYTLFLLVVLMDWWSGLLRRRMVVA